MYGPANSSNETLLEISKRRHHTGNEMDFAQSFRALERPYSVSADCPITLF